MRVLGTAGHVDHGKSTFLNRLTGMSPDRLPEEKKRGMTIDLNFVWFEHNGEKVGVVDVPGHHRFVKNMVSGVMQIDAFLFMVAADDGWMPQSEEHLQVLKSLGVRQGIAILSKTDLVSEERAAEVQTEVAKRIQSVLGVDVPVLPFDPISEDKLTVVRREIDQLLSKLPKAVEDQGARIWVDRVFTPKGLGVVVTGTLREGSLSVGETVQCLPSKESALVRGLQSYQEDTKTAQPVSRVALQLGKIEAQSLHRGDLIHLGPNPALTKVIDTEVEFFEATKVKNQNFAFHVGTRREEAFVIPMGSEKEVTRCYARIKFHEPVPVRSGDRFLLRTVGEEKTVGGGQVIDPLPTLSSHKKAKEFLKEWAPTPEGWLGYQLRKYGMANIDTLAAQSVFSKTMIESAAANCRKLSGFNIADEKRWSQWLAVLDQVVEALHAKGKDILPVEDVLAGLRSVIAKPDATLKALLEDAQVQKHLIQKPGGYQKAGFQKALSPEESKLFDRIEAEFAKVAGSPVSLKEMAREAKSLIQAQVQAKTWIALGQDHYMKAADYSAACQKVTEKLRAEGQATTSILRSHLNTSRKLAVLILERMDRDRITFLKEGLRRLLR